MLYNKFIIKKRGEFMDYFEKLLHYIKIKNIEINWIQVKKKKQIVSQNLLGYSLSKEVLNIYENYVLFELNWSYKNNKGFVNYIPYNCINKEHQNLLEVMNECYDMSRDNLGICEDIKNWYPLFKFPNGDYFCLDKRTGKIVFFEHDVCDSGINLHGLTIALSINDLFEKWSECMFLDVYDWYDVVDKDGINIEKIYQLTNMCL